MLEAMATGMPVLATLHGGIPEAVRHGVTGLLVAERDRDGLFDSMVRMTSEPGLWSQMSRAAAEDIRENFESRAQITKLEDIYFEAAASAYHV
jgi:colanic acid/amylovoran biosynthesis glycosyltransferase